MTDIMDILIERMEARAMRRIGELSLQLLAGRSDDRELTLAELEFQCWLADYCGFCAEPL